MLRDLAALTPPLVVCGAFLIGVVLFLRRQMGPRSRSEDHDDGADIRDASSNTESGDPEATPSPDRAKS